MFPQGFPDFTADQRDRLKELGVIEEQVTELRRALMIVRSHVRRPPANNEVAEHLADIERLASELSRKLRPAVIPAPTPDSRGADCEELSRKLRTAVIPDAARLIEERYWPQRPTDDGPTVALHLCPRLDALANAAASAIGVVPKGQQARSSASKPEPVRCIDEALHFGWTKAYGSNTAAWIDPKNEEAEIDEVIERIASKLPAKGSDAAVALAQKQQYPDTLRPSVSEGRAFPEIVGICYAAVGYTTHPKRAIQAYVTAYNANRTKMLKAFNEALSEAE